MQHSGTKLVITLIGLALLLGGISWWYRYEAAHRSTRFWGAEASWLIAESEGFEVISFEPGRSENLSTLGGIDTRANSTNLSKARGQAHLRHALMSDRNYVWGKTVDTAVTRWRWSLRFYEPNRQIHVVLSNDLSVIGKYELADNSVTAYSCEPMTASLAEYFRALGLLNNSTL